MNGMTARALSWTDSGMFSSLLMTVLLLRISGIALLERDITERRPGYADYVTERRPGYADYVRGTNALSPGPPHTPGAGGASA